MSTAPQDQIVIEGSRVILNTLLGSQAHYQRETTVQKFSQSFLETAHAPQIFSFGLTPVDLRLRGIYQNHGYYVVLVEVLPGMRHMQWISKDSPEDFGVGTTFSSVGVSLPWQYFFITLDSKGSFTGNNSVYFSRHPITKLDQPLLEPHFLNCSVKAHDLYCWVCTQYFSSNSGNQSILSQAGTFLEQFWSKGFNRSSEHHEGNSFFSKNAFALRQHHVGTIEEWQAASQKRPEDFGLNVPWITSPHTVRSVYRELTTKQRSWVPITATNIATLIPSPE